MYPILFSYGQFAIYALGTFMVVGFIAFNTIVVQLAVLKKMDLNFWNKHILSLSIVAIVGARILYVLTHLDRFQDNWQAVLVPDGFSFYGGILSAVTVLHLYSQKAREDFLRWSDACTVAFFAFLFCSGIGHFLDGSNYGLPTDLPWGITFDNIASPVEYTVPIHPTQLYQAMGSLLIFFVTLFLYQKTKFRGITTFWGGFLLGLGNFFLNYLLGEETVMIGVLRLEQVFDLLLIAVSSSILFSFFLKKPAG